MQTMPLNPSFMDRLPADLGLMVGKVFQTLAVIGEEALELIMSLWILIMVERAFGQQGVGVYSYLMALLYITRYIADCGVARHMEHEAAVCGSSDPECRELAAEGFQASLAAGLAASILLLATAGFDAAHTRVEERLAAYVVIAIILPLANLNYVKLSLLQGMGHHGRVARLSLIRHGIVLGVMFLLTRLPVPPSFLLLAHLTSEVCMAVVIRRHLKIPGIRALRIHSGRILMTFRKGRAFLFTDNGLDVLLNLDLFVLGLFVSAWDLGVYAEAAVIVRFFLVVPAAIKPLFRRRYNMMAAQHAIEALLRLVRRRTAVLFSLHAILAVCVLLTYPVVLNFFFQTRGEEILSFKLFAVFVPGLIFYSAFSTQEPLYEAVGQVAHMRRLTMLTSGINLVLTFYLVPFAGSFGAATATMTTMLVYFALFGYDLATPLGIGKSTYVIAGLAVYLVFIVLEWWDIGTAANYGLAPLLLGALFYAIGLFGVAEQNPVPG